MALSIHSGDTFYAVLPISILSCQTPKVAQEAGSDKPTCTGMRPQKYGIWSSAPNMGKGRNCALLLRWSWGVITKSWLSFFYGVWVNIISEHICLHPFSIWCHAMMLIRHGSHNNHSKICFFFSSSKNRCWTKTQCYPTNPISQSRLKKYWILDLRSRLDDIEHSWDGIISHLI